MHADLRLIYIRYPIRDGEACDQNVGNSYHDENDAL